MVYRHVKLTCINLYFILQGGCIQESQTTSDISTVEEESKTKKSEGKYNTLYSTSIYWEYAYLRNSYGRSVTQCIILGAFQIKLE